MAATSGIPEGYSKSCCSTPQAIVGPYQEKGSYMTIAGLKTYITGPSTATKGLFVVYDVLAFKPQTIQGADILASKGDTLVVVPDVFLGHPGADASWLPPDTPEKQAALGNFFQTVAAASAVVPRINPVIDEVSAKYPSIKSWSGMGFCWGAKIIAALSGEGTRFKCAVQTSPAMLDLKDAEAVKIPMIVLASSNEDAATVQEYGPKLPKGSSVRIFSDMIHGWMSARGDLNDPKVKAQYEEGYQLVLKFLEENA